MKHRVTDSKGAPKKKVVSCPHCGTSVVWDAANPYRPFCCERCKMIDLGAWATESYRIPVAEDDESPDDDQGSGSRPTRE
ncbi:MAG TPA: DNA gyrase inhibitor YacG [Burkholderiales bacterium]|nr:DNA gyrase inhibitor YacG [Burkholderiales bacterium]